MNHIVTVICPFITYQEVAVYKNGECIKNVKCNLDDLTDTCYILCKQYNINQLDVKGPKLYTMHLLDELKSSKYDNFNININIY